MCVVQIRVSNGVYNSCMCVVHVRRGTHKKMEVYYLPKALDSKTADALFAELEGYEKWIQSKFMGHLTPRLQQWFGCGEGMSYKFGGRRYAPEGYPEWLKELQERITRIVRSLEVEGFRAPNSVLINKYRDGKDKIQWHADNNPEFGEKPTIISVNVGQTRRFCVKPLGAKGRKETQTFYLGHGDILVMAGSTQEKFVHCVPGESKPTSGFSCRYNLTFRPYCK